MKRLIQSRTILIGMGIIIFMLFGWLYVDCKGLKMSLQSSQEIVCAETGKGSALEKIIERIKKAGLEPREARYYKVLEQK